MFTFMFTDAMLVLAKAEMLVGTAVYMCAPNKVSPRLHMAELGFTSDKDLRHSHFLNPTSDMGTPPLEPLPHLSVPLPTVFPVWYKGQVIFF